MNEYKDLPVQTGQGRNERPFSKTDAALSGRKIKHIFAVYFSPTGNTARIVTHIANILCAKLGTTIDVIDYTLPHNREAGLNFTKDDLVIWGTPVYAGRTPNKLLYYIRCAKGNGALAVPVAVFGNRNYDDCLLELQKELEKNSFHTIAGAAFVSAHVFSDKIAPGRPDVADREEMQGFATKLAEKIRSMTTIPKPITISKHDVVGEYYTPLGIDGKPAIFLKAKPKTDEAKCIRCGLCASVCPVGSISEDNPLEVTGICIKCQACIIICPNKAKYMDDPAFISHKAMLENNYTRRAANKVFLPDEEKYQKPNLA